MTADDGPGAGDGAAATSTTSESSPTEAARAAAAALLRDLGIAFGDSAAPFEVDRVSLLDMCLRRGE
jgi:hypothetical protein